MRLYFKGKMSTFGGPRDHGVKSAEGLALVNRHNEHFYKQYFLPEQPIGTTGYARRLDPDKFYIACRWDYKRTPAGALSHILVKVTNIATGHSAYARPIDWGPNEEKTNGRVADLSPGLAYFLGLRTDDLVEVKYN